MFWPDFLFTGGQGCGDLNGTGSGAHCPAQTAQQYRTAYSMWALGAAPLIIAVDVANMTTVRVMVLSRCSAHSSLANPWRAMHQTQRETLLNPEVTAMHQDPLGDPGKRVRSPQL